jgi:YidC/Oxa1 family membrane protein insertase
MRHGKAPEGESAMMSTFTGPALYTEAAKYQKVKFEDIAKGKAEHAKNAQDGWMGMVQHHFVSAWMTRDPADKSPREFYTRTLGNDEYSAGIIMPAVKVAPGATQTASMRLYAGPQDQETLKDPGPRPGTRRRLRLADHPRLPHLRPAQLAGKPGAQLGHGHHPAHRADQAGLLPAVRRQL